MVIGRNFHGIKKSYWEISEDFRHYFNLYEDRKNEKICFIHIDNNGDEETVAVIEKDNIRIKLAYIKEFLAVKNMSLIIEYEFNRYSTKTLKTQGLQKLNVDKVTGDNYCYTYYIHNLKITKDICTHSRLFGVKVIYGSSEPKSKTCKENKTYAEYCIGFNKDGQELYSTCDEEKLSNFYGKNKGAPQYLTPVAFKKEVLLKYYSNPSKYSVDDSMISCGSLWILKIDNNHPEYVTVFLGDLGHLETAEQIYWKQYNIKTEGTFSHTSWQRNFEAKFENPEKSDLIFKSRYQQVNKNWKEKMGWDLFQPLSEEDEYHFKTLRIPLTNEQKEFDEQVLSLTKLIIDSLNEKEFTKKICADSLPKNAKSITKFEEYLKSQGYTAKEMFNFLRSLQNLRSTGVAHKKGEKYSEIKKTFGINNEENHLSDIFDCILAKTIGVLNAIDYKILKTEKRDTA